jgi:hypothetical protein
LSNSFLGPTTQIGPQARSYLAEHRGRLFQLRDQP